MSSPRSTILAYLQLFRLPNVFTAVADVTMGFLFMRAADLLSSSNTVLVLGLVMTASSLMYTAGMVLNDVFDLEQDRAERPHRPLPSGRIAVVTAQFWGWGMLAAGTGVAWVADLVTADAGVTWRSGPIALALATCIVLYDGVVKRTVLGPVFMGACRSLNILLGMSGGAMTALGDWDAAALTVAAGMGVYVAGITWFARSEARQSSRGGLLLGTALIVGGLAILASFPQVGNYGDGTAQLTFRSAWVWPLLVVLLGASIVRRCLTAIARPSPQRVQTAVKQCILSIIILDAAICLAVRSPVIWAIAILALLAPTLILGKWVYST